MSFPPTDALRRALDSRRPMAMYIMPGGDSTYTLFESATPRPLVDEESDFGLFYAPFAHRGEAPMLLSRRGDDGSQAYEILPVEIPAYTSPEVYAAHVESIIAQHSALGGGKTVYARRISDPTARADWAAIAEEYMDLFPDTFRFLFATPDAGCWLGASPELLLRRRRGSDTVETMALAGTLRADSQQWDDKNREEHDYVTRFIVDTMRDFGLNPKVGPAEEVRFGSLRHLCHRITASYTGPLVPLLNRLSPTPALSGFPREESLRTIERLEGDRSLYGGYVGVNDAEGTYVAVNLRSVCFNPHSGGYCIYAGGGITSLSDPADEWLETESKSQRLRECVKRHTQG